MSSPDIEWRSRLHCPTHVQQLQQPRFEHALRTACQVVLPSLTNLESPSASVVLLGPSSSGKSLLTRFIIDTVSAKIASSSGGQLVVVQLNGLIHSTPTRAWCHVAQTLLDWYRSKCHGVSDSDSRKYYDIETATNSDDDPAVVSQLQDTVLPALDHIRKTESGLILVLDHLHRFTSSDPLSQTVLYSLLNFLQDRSLRAACIAQTSIFDITDLLEKRVSSRFSHRKIVMPLIDSYDEIREFLFSALVPISEPSQTGESISSRPGGRGGSRKRASTGKIVQLADPDALREVSRTLLTDPRFKDSVNRYLTRSRVVAPILWAVDAALSFVPHDDKDFNISAAMVKAIAVVIERLGTWDCTEASLTSLTILQLQLLVALCKIEANQVSETARGKRDGDAGAAKLARTVFENVYEEYMSLGKMDEGTLAERDVSQNLVDRSVAERAWELLVEGGIVVRTGTGPRDARPVVCSVGKSAVDAAVEKHSGSTTVMRNWARRKTVR